MNNESVMKYNFVDKSLVSIMNFTNTLEKQPDFCQLDDQQRIGILASDDDALWFDI